jgi:Nuclease-related domain
MPQPDPDPGGFWPSCDDEQPGVSIRPLSHADLAALLAHLDQHNHQDPGPLLGSGAPAPVLAVRVWASVGRPGASAHAEYRRRRAIERAAWACGLPWRASAVLAVGVTAWLLAAQVTPDLAALVSVVVAAGVGWRLRFHSSGDTQAWRRGADGERRTARLLAPLERHGWAVLHDLAIPGSPANIDHLVVGPGGVLVIDSKQYRRRLWMDSYGLRWHGRDLLVAALRKVRWEADQADEILGVADVQVAAIVAIHGASVPWGRLEADGGHRRWCTAGARPATGAAADPWAGAGGLVGRPGPAAVPPSRVASVTGARRQAGMGRRLPTAWWGTRGAPRERRPAPLAGPPMSAGCERDGIWVARPPHRPPQRQLPDMQRIRPLLVGQAGVCRRTPASSRVWQPAHADSPVSPARTAR